MAADARRATEDRADVPRVRRAGPRERNEADAARGSVVAVPNIRWLLALITRLQRWLYLRTNGAIGASIFGVTMLLLTTVGRKSGRERQIPLLYIEDGERLVLIAS